MFITISYAINIYITRSCVKKRFGVDYEIKIVSVNRGANIPQ